ncbi:hypothetical protein B0H11DRAFT_2225795 [Mycena galericulata]|nr:hypothetical protein B0H11DRAFT_2225795 [Mycena galericulata]
MSAFIKDLIAAKSKADINTSAVKGLAQDGARFTNAIGRTSKDSNPADSMNDGLENLTTLFNEMNKFCDKHAECSLLYRIFKRSTHAAKIAQYQHSITHALATLGVEANLRIIANQEQILKKLDGLESVAASNPEIMQSGVRSTAMEEREANLRIIANQEQIIKKLDGWETVAASNPEIMQSVVRSMAMEEREA